MDVTQLRESCYPVNMDLSYNKRMYTHGQTITVTVESVLPFGVFVRLEDGARAYIRRRELTLSGDIAPQNLVSAGQQLRAAITKLASSESLMELSVRNALPDPWQEFAHHRPGDVVTATVKNLFPDWVFAEIVPGVDGQILLRELAAWQVAQPEDVVWPGDCVEAVITHLDVPAKRVQLSIRRRLEQLAQVETIAEHLYQKAKDRSLEDEPTEESKLAASKAPQQDKVELAGPILVVEDHDAVREPLVRWLVEQGCSAQGADTAVKALSLCREHAFGLIIVDLGLPGVDGMSLVRQLGEAGVSAPVAVMSGPELIAGQWAELETWGVAAAFAKPLDLDEIQGVLVQVGKGERPALTLGSAQVTPLATAQSFQRLTDIMRSGQSLAERFRQGLEQLVRDTRGQAGLIFHMDRVSQQVSVVACAGHVGLNEEAIYKLVDSPVKDIIVEGGMVWENRVSSERTGRFRKLMDLLPFESCIGLPLQAGGQVEYALFLFNTEADAFSRYRLRDALAAASLFSVALESQILDERVQSLGRTLLSGHLAAGFGHEVYNKVSGLDLQLRNVASDFNRSALGAGRSEPFDQQVQKGLEQAMGIAASLKRTVEDFQRLMRTEEERSVDVNLVIRQAETQVRPLALRVKVSIRLELDADLPLVAASNIRLQHVFLNLMLNAVQHMEHKPDARRVLTVSTICTRNNPPGVQVRFSDTGPGIHRQLWDKIFALGFTSRPGGSGLGLYLARSLVESMGGRIGVEASLVPLGSTFLVELPA